MAGHRQRSGSPTRANARIARFRKALADAQTVERQLSLAFDWWRVAHRHSPDALRRMAQALAAAALDTDRRTPA